jgi:hypothetical protein
MKDVRMTKESRLLQVFLTPENAPEPRVSEVHMDDKQRLSCNCSGYKGRSACKHVEFVQKKIKDNEGHYPVPVIKSAPKFVTKDMSSEDLRKFILTYGKIEVF